MKVINRRIKIERRRISYTYHIPENRINGIRRKMRERRCGIDRRSGTDRRIKKVNPSIV